MNECYTCYTEINNKMYIQMCCIKKYKFVQYYSGFSMSMRTVGLRKNCHTVLSLTKYTCMALYKYKRRYKNMEMLSR